MIGQVRRIYELQRLSHSPVDGMKKIVAFTSGKGGTGKTFLSLNIAYLLAEKNKRVLYIDLDPNLSNSSIMINHVPGLTIYDFFKKKKLFSEVITEYTTNLHFIFGSSGKTDFPLIDKSHIAFLFDQIRLFADRYDIVILDTASGAGDEVIDIILNADVNVIVTNPEPTAVMDAYVMIKLLNKNRYNKRKYILVNRCNNLEEGNTTFYNLSSAAGHFLKESDMFLLGVAYSGPEVSQSIIEQNLLVKKYPHNPISIQIAEASSRLIEYVQMANIMQASEEGNR